MSLIVKGIGTAVPEPSIAQADAARAWAVFACAEGRKARTIQALYRRSGVKKRHSSLLEGASDGLGPNQTFFEPVRFQDDPGPTTGARMARFEADAPGLASQAARAALANASMEGREVTHFVTVSCTGFFCSGTGHDASGPPGSSAYSRTNPRGIHGLPRGVEWSSRGLVLRSG